MKKRKRKPTNLDKVNELDEIYNTRGKRSKTPTSGKTLPSDSQRFIYWLKKIADSGGIQSIKDLATWQKDMRKYRSLSVD